MPATRLMPTEEGQDLIDLTREICDKELRPRVDDAERAAATDEPSPPRPSARSGRAGLLSLPYPEEFGGDGQPYEVYLQVVEEIASAWMSVAVGVSVHSLTGLPGGDRSARAEQQAALLPGMLSGEQLGAYCLSEPLAGSDVGVDDAPARRPRAAATASPTAYRLKGTQGVDHPRRPRRLLHDLRAHVRRRRAAGCPASSCPPTRPACRSARPSGRWACTATPCAR